MQKYLIAREEKSHHFLSSSLQQELHSPVLIKQLSVHSYIREREEKNGSWMKKKRK